MSYEYLSMEDWKCDVMHMHTIRVSYFVPCREKSRWRQNINVNQARFSSQILYLRLWLHPSLLTSYSPPIIQSEKPKKRHNTNQKTIDWKSYVWLCFTIYFLWCTEWVHLWSLIWGFSRNRKEGEILICRGSQYIRSLDK